MLHFEEYQGKDSHSGRTRRGEMVTVQRRGLMSFSAGALAVLGSPAAVKFLVDREAKVIGFRPCKLREKNAHAVRGKQHVVSAVAVLKHMGADLSESRCYTLKVEDGLPPHIDLNEDADVVTSNRRKARPAATA
jgi:hypothetical protein